jgi:hypothetical protein
MRIARRTAASQYESEFQSVSYPRPLTGIYLMSALDAAKEKIAYAKLLLALREYCQSLPVL